jgi:hypothetical protein
LRRAGCHLIQIGGEMRKTVVLAVLAVIVVIIAVQFGPSFVSH